MKSKFKSMKTKNNKEEEENAYLLRRVQIEPWNPSKFEDRTLGPCRNGEV